MQYIQEIKEILAQARQKTYQAINSAMVEAYWKIGQKIILEEQNGKERADYGKEIIHNVSLELTKEFGKGYSKRTLWEIRQFYFYFQGFEIVRTLFAQLSWSHYQRVLRVSNPEARLIILQRLLSKAGAFVRWIETFLPCIINAYYPPKQKK